MEPLTEQQRAFLKKRMELGLLAILILFAFLALANEKKHMAIIQALERNNPARRSDRKN